MTEKLAVCVGANSGVDIVQDNQDEDWDLYHDPEIVESLNRARRQMKVEDCIPAEIVIKNV
ncbi:MAG: hypothetical protein OXN17_17750 [Candidatus Poribacteria bacterium]|nr:hypothetical protein [Candidatus Poribacteria bacterium]MDE0502564.1 hypothetical protein [Candidatus Poribacteria bacterium]